MAAASDLTRFLDAQAPVMEQVKDELRAGRKRTHWMWFIFPQLRGLGFSRYAQYYGIEDLTEADAYLDHPVLGARLRDCVWLLLGHADRSAYEIMGSPDDMKLRSCLTLFQRASRNDADKALFSRALDTFYKGEADPRTLEILPKTP